MSFTLDLTKGLGDFEHYKAWKFPGGELDFILKAPWGKCNKVQINTRIDSSDDLILLCLAVDVLRKDCNIENLNVFIPYMPYQQADRNFGKGESFALKSICNVLNSLPVDKYTIFDPHSDVSPALLKNCITIDNSEFIEYKLIE